MSMHRGTSGVMGICCLGWFLLLLFSGYGHAGECQQWVAKAVSIQGIVQVQREGTATWEAVARDDPLCAGDVLRVLEKSRAALVLRNEAVIRLDEKTALTIKPETGSKALLLRLLDGAIHFFSRIRHSLNVATPFVNGAVEGTEFFVRVSKEQAYFSVFKGRVRVENSAGERLLADNTAATIAKGEAPVLKAVARPRDAVNWALYYPTIVSAGKRIVSKQLISASELLQVGRVDAAQKILRQIITNDPNNSDALALSAIIELVQNRKEKARTLAEKASDLDPDSSVAKMALAYVRQAFFDVEAARDILEEAVSVDPQNALLWARLAELWLATGYQGKALSAAKNATALSPDTSRSQTVLGFAYISQVKIKKAKEAFRKAIDMDQADPLSRLGLGLAMIRDGDLDKGREQIEIAAALDPGNSLIRSYLGKAFYDEKENRLAGRQFEVAEELDPNDPTPYFYNAIKKQTENRPVEALQDLQQSIALNDNRAVYRSRLLLDDDLAVRSASLARIYNDLGYDQLALVEGWKSVNSDPTNHSAHRFLADSYAAIPHYEIARVSELLQSQLTQPINITPVPPQLAESGLSILEGSGPGDSTYNEFNPLFLRNRLALQASGIVGENDTLGDEVMQAGVLGKFSYSLGQFHYETDGFRENNEQEIDIYNAFGQLNVTPSTSLQAEYRYSHTENGDLELTFFETFNPEQDVDDKVNTYRFGLRHAFAPNSLLLGSFIYQDAELSTVVAPEIYEFGADVDYYVGELNYQTTIGSANYIAGFGHRQKDTTEEIEFFGEIEKDDNKTEFTNVYLYSLIDLPLELLLTIGGSGEFLNGATEEEDSEQFNPKLGLMCNFYPKTTFRVAVFRTLHRPLVSKRNIDPTLELTQVAGFNQFYLGAEGDESWHYGVGIDQAVVGNLFVGAEFVFRDIEERFLDDEGPTPEVEQYSREDYWLRSYLNWSANSWSTFGIEYLYENVNREKADDLVNIEEFSKLSTHRIPISMKLFHPLGITAGVKASYVYQKGDFINPTDVSIITDSDQFWVVDAAIEYRLPERYGVIKLEAKNLFDEKFHFQDTDPANPKIFPDRVVLLRLTVSF